MSTENLNSQETPQETELTHEEKMVAIAEGRMSPDGTPLSTDEGEPKAERPANVPAKFWNEETGAVDVDAMAKSYAELEKRQSTEEKPKALNSDLKSEAESGNEQRQDEDNANTDDDDDATKEAKAVAQAAGLNFEAMSEEYLANGKLSDETYATAEAGGIPRNTIDSFIEGQHAIAAIFRSEVMDIAGGEDNYQAMIEWIRSDLSNEEREAYNASLDLKDKAQAKSAVSGMVARFQASQGTRPNLVTPATGGSEASAGAFESEEELVAAMQDPRYKVDPAYRAKVAKRLASSSIV